MDEPPKLAGERLCVALVLAPMDNEDALATLLRLTGIPSVVVNLKPWAAAWLEVPEPATAGEEELLTGSRPVPQAVDRVARVISRLSRHGSVALVSWLYAEGGTEPGVSGVVTAKRYVGGEAENDLDAGLLLNNLDLKAEDLLLGRARPEDYAKKKRWGRRKRTTEDDS